MLSLCSASRILAQLSLMWCFWCITYICNITPLIKLKLITTLTCMRTHHEVSLWSSGSCHSKGHYCLTESPGPSGGKETTGICNHLHFWSLCRSLGLRILTQRSWNAHRQEHTVGRYLDSLIHEKPPPPAVWWLGRAAAGWRLYAEIRRLPGCCWDWAGGGPGPHTCWGGGCLDGHSTGLAGRNESGKK